MEKEKETVSIPLSALKTTDVTENKLNQMAKGFILGTMNFEKGRQIKEELEQKVTKKIGRKGKLLVDKLFELIEGVYIIDSRGGAKGDKIRYYQSPPQLQAIIYALDRVLGKPKVYSEHTEEKKGILLVEHIIKNLAGKKNEGENINIGGEISERESDRGGSVLVEGQGHEGVGVGAV